MSEPSKKMGVQNGWVDTNGYHRVKIKGVTYMKHRLIMEEHLGRPLEPNQNVHHINGDRGDNRIENLELWNTHQPPGQRIEDKLAWARDIIRLYGTTLEKEAAIESAAKGFTEES